MSESGREKRIEISIDCEAAWAESEVEAFQRLIEHILGRFDIHEAEISVCIGGDEDIVEVNKRYLDRDTKTDVISFDLSETGDTIRIFDIIVNADRAQREAQGRGHDAIAELALYITHGILHNIGFDDDTQENAGRMHAMEDEILGEIGFGRVFE